MNNFASQIMVNILSKSAFAHELSTENLPQITSDEYATALIPIDVKRDILSKIVFRSGMSALLHQDYGVAYYKNNPCISALLYQATPEQLVQRWQRLERYIHSEHFIHIISSTNHSITIEHRSHKKIPPTLVEDMAVMGVIKSLLKQAGAIQVELSAITTSNNLTDESSASNTWHFQWQDVLPSQEENSSLSSVAEEQLYASFPKELQSVARAIGFDELFNPRVQQIAKKLNLSSRSFQRKLLQQGVTFSKLVQKQRLLKSSHYLLRSNLALPEIGFLSGFSDQSHFCRTFKKIIGMSPQKYRKIINKN